MNCDQAFDLLTDLERRRSPRLAAHLAGCPRCQDMARTLSPVLGLWEQAAGPADPAPDERGTAARRATALSAVPGKGGGSGVDQRNERWKGIRRWIAAFAAGMVVALGLHTISGRPAPSLAPPAPGESSACAWLTRDAPSVGTDTTPESLILSCVACHVRPPAGGDVPFPRL